MEALSYLILLLVSFGVAIVTTRRGGLRSRSASSITRTTAR
jgi:hypothetical protein